VISVARKRQKMNQRADVDWEVLIKNSLYKSAQTERWGCLNKDGKLFRIATLKSVQVPISIIHKMETEGVLKLNNGIGMNTMYRYTPIKRRGKRVKRTLQ